MSECHILRCFFEKFSRESKDLSFQTSDWATILQRTQSIDWPNIDSISRLIDTESLRSEIKNDDEFILVYRELLAEKFDINTNDFSLENVPEASQILRSRLRNLKAHTGAYKRSSIQPPNNATPTPPVAAHKTLYFLLPRSEREHAFGDLEEVFLTEVVPKFGIAFARRWYWIQTLSMIGHFYVSRLLSFGKFAVGLKVVEWVLRKF
mgnify:CR=1 FL=1